MVYTTKQTKFAAMFLLYLMTSLLTAILCQTDAVKVYIRRCESIRSDIKINKIHIDKINNVWLASSDGVIKLDSFGVLQSHYFENYDFIDIVSDKKDNIWATTEDAIYHLNDGKISPYLTIMLKYHV
ncbi:MAG: hypothetical protein IPL55_06505 [Saprospiraceae bacterium]|nr:hypothetical protein [Saprospiraceae bacterium]